MAVFKRSKQFILGLLSRFSGLIAIVFSILVLVLISIQVALFWLNTDKGNRWLSELINAQIQTTGYQLDFSGFGLLGPTALRLKHLEVLHEQQKIVEIDKLDIDISLLLAGLKKLDLELSAERVAVLNLPPSSDEPKPPKTRLELPNLYFNAAELKLDITTLSVAKAVMGETLTTSISAQQDIDIQPKTIAIEGAIELARTEHSQSAFFPHKLSNHVVLDTAKQGVKVSKLEIINPIYVVDGSAIYGLMDEHIGLDLKAQVDDPQAISTQLKALKEPIVLSTQLTGTVAEFDALVKIKTRYADVPTQIKAVLERSNELFKLTQLDGRGGDLKLTGQLQYNLATALGRGEIDAQLSDLGMINQFIQLDPFSGTLSARAKLYSNNSTQALDLDAQLKQFSYQSYAVKRLDLKANLSDLMQLKGLKADAQAQTLKFLDYQLAELNAAAQVGDLKQLRHIELNVQADALNSQLLSLERAKLIATVGDAKQLKGIDAQLNLRQTKLDSISMPLVQVQAESSGKGFKVHLEGAGQSYHSFDFNALAQVNSTQTINVGLERLELNAGGGQISAAGEVRPAKLDLGLTVRDLNLQTMAFADLSGVPVLLNTVDAQLKGTLAKPTLDAQYQIQPTTAPELAAKVRGRTQYRGSVVDNSIQIQSAGGLEGDLELQLPLQLALQPFAFQLAEDAPLDGRLDLSADLAQVGQAFLDPGLKLQGQFGANAQIGGVLNDPLLDGQAKLSQGGFLDEYNSIELKAINAQLVFKDRIIELQSLTATDAPENGSLKATARADISNLQAPEVEANLVLDNMQLINNKNYAAWIDANIKFAQQALSPELVAASTQDSTQSVAVGQRAYVISGTLAPREISIVIPDHFDASIPALNVVEEEEPKPSDGVFSKILLDLTFDADGDIFAIGRGLNAEFAGNLKVGGDLQKPLVKGELETVRGSFEEFGRRFTLDKVLLRFQGPVPPSPYLDVNVSTDVEGIKAKIALSDSVLDPDFTLSSEPALPEDEVLSLILFGRSLSNISSFQALQLANTLRELSGKGGGSFDPLERIQQATGLDDIYVEGVGTENATVGAGKYLADNVYLEVEQGAGEASGEARVEIELTPSVKVESKATQEGETEIGVFWERSY